MKINQKLLDILQSKNVALDFLKREKAPQETKSIKIRPVSNTLSMTQSSNLLR